MRNKTKLIIAVSVIAIVVVAFVGIIIYRNNYYKTHWDTRKHVSDELRDYQSYWICNGRLLKGKNGFYIIGSERDWNGNKLCFWDGKSKEYDIVCKVSNCKHSSEKCCAWFSDNAYNFQYSNDYIFYNDWDEEWNEWLYRCETDGTNRAPIMMIADHNTDTYVPSLMVHNNHILIAKEIDYDDRTEICLMDYDMSGKKKKEYEIIKHEGNGSILIHDIIGTKVLYGITDKTTDIYEYDIKTKENVRIKSIEDTTGFINYVNGGLVYSNQNKVILFKNDKEIVLNEGQGNQIGCDGKYLYVDNAPMFSHDPEENKLNHTVMVFDFDGNLIHKIDMPENTKKKMQVCYFGDGKKIFVSNFTDEEVYVMDVAELKKAKWSVIKLFD